MHISKKNVGEFMLEIELAAVSSLSMLLNPTPV